MHKHQSIEPKHVRYIKLGERGCWEKECIDKSILRFGFGTHDHYRIALCRNGEWDRLHATL